MGKSILLLMLSMLFLNSSSSVHAFPVGSGTCNASALSVSSQTHQHPITDLLGFYLDFPTQYSPGQQYPVYIRNSGKNLNISYFNGFLIYAQDANGVRQGTFATVTGETRTDMCAAIDSILDPSTQLSFCGMNNSKPNSTLTHENGGLKQLGLQVMWTAPMADVGLITWQGMVEHSDVMFYVQVLTPWMMCSPSNVSSCIKFDPSTLPTGPLPPPNPVPVAPSALVPVSTSTCGAYLPLALASLPAGFCVSTYAVNMSRARSIFVLQDDLFVVEAGDDEGKISGVSVLRDINADGVIDLLTEYFRIWNQLGLTHGMYVANGFVYASSPTTVWRVPLNVQDVTRPVDSSQIDVMVKNIPEIHHTTRTLLVNEQWLYLSIGSGSNVDPDDSRSRVNRYNLSAAMPVGGWQWNNYTSQAVVAFAVGLRNEVGLTFDLNGIVWGVMNGDDELNRTDLGGYSIHNNNPAERLDKLTEANINSWYGYPFCWAVESLPPYFQGDMLSWGGAGVDYYTDGYHTDAWCQANALPPEYAFEAHTAPLGLAFYNGSGMFAFPTVYSNAVFITQHGSWDSDTPRGYKVILIMTDGRGNVVNNSVTDFFKFEGPGDVSSLWPHKPVDVKVGANGELFVSSDGSSDDSSGTIFVIRYMNTASAVLGFSGCWWTFSLIVVALLMSLSQ